MNKNIYSQFRSAKSEKIEILKINIVRDSNDNVEYIVHQLRKEMDNGDLITYYKATKFFKLTRVSKASKDNVKFLAIHADIIRGLYSIGSHYVQIVANILKPEPFGLVYLYGVQETGATPDDAIYKAKNSFKGFMSSFKGTHRTAHIIDPTKEEINWVFKKIKEQKYITVVKGIPAPRLSSGAQKKNDLVQIDNSNEEQMEQFLAGMINDEFIMMVMASPIGKNSLRSWLNASLKEATKWESQKQGSNSINFGVSIPMSMGSSSGVSTGESEGSSLSEGISKGESSTQGTSFSKGITEGFSDGTSTTDSHSTGTSESNGWSETNTKGTSDTDTSGSNRGFSLGVSGGVTALNGNVGGNFSWSDSHADGTSTSEAKGFSGSSGSSASDSHSTGKTYSSSYSDSTTSGVSSSKGINTGTSSSAGKSAGTSHSVNTGLSQSFGIAPSLSIGKSYQFVDKQVEYICELLSVQNKRLANSIEGEGAFFVDFYISSPNTEIQKGIQSLVASTWINNDAKIDVLKGLIPDKLEQKKLSLHMLSFSPCYDMEINRNGKYYKYSSVLQSSEFGAYSHPPRISIGGIDSAVEDRPKMRIPINRQNKEIFIGNIVNGEVFNVEQYKKHKNGYLTDYKFCIGSNEIHHALFSGSSGSGKSVLATRAVHGLYNNTATVDRLTGKTKKRRILILDPKGEWRQMCQVVSPDKFRFFSIGNPQFHPLKMNLLRCPKYISANDYFNIIVEHFCSAYGLLDRAYAQISKTIYNLYDREGAFDNVDDPFWAYERTKNVTLKDAYDELTKERDEADKAGRRYDSDALTTYLTRLQMYNLPKAKEHLLFCNKGGMSIDQVLGDDSITVIESNGLSPAGQSFFFTLLMDGIFKFAQATGGFYQEGQYETVIVLEEANTVLCPENKGGDDGGGSAAIKKFELLIDQSRSYGLFVWTITQKVSAMPSSVIANAGLIFSGKNLQEQDTNILLKACGFDGRIENRDVAKWFPRMPIGEFIIKINKGFEEVDQEPVMVKVAEMKIEKPSDEELDLIIQEGDLLRNQ